jgi:large subunit ribosomal protein L4
VKLPVQTLGAESAGDIEVSDAVFGIETIRGDILQRMVTYQLAKRRGGNHKVQTRNENSRTGKKMYKQKGTGGARHGSRRAPQFVGGSRAFGPVVRSHAFDLPKKIRALALRHALSSKVKAGTLMVLDNATLDQPKTSMLLERFAGLGLTAPRS